MELNRYSWAHIHDLKESGFRKTQVFTIKGKTGMGYPYPVYPVYYGNDFLIGFPRYKDAVKFRDKLWARA